MPRHKVIISGIDTNRLKVIKNEKTIEMIKAYQAGKKEVFDEVVLGNLKLVLSIVQRFSDRAENMDDLFQIGCVGLIKSILNFQTTQGVNFSTYAVPMIMGEIRRYLRDDSPIHVSRQIRDLAYHTLRVKEQFLLDHNYEPSHQQIAQILGVNAFDVKEALDSIQGVSSLFEPVYNESGDTLYIIDQIPDEFATQERLSNQITLQQGLRSLPVAQHKVISDRYFMGKTQFEIAMEMGISQAQVSRLEKTALQNLRTFF